MNKVKRSFFLLIMFAAIAGIVIFCQSIYVVPIIMYHNIDDNWEESKLSVSPESFNRQMQFLKKHNYNVISLDELAALRRSKQHIPYKTIAITFDDGYENNYVNAFQTLKKYKMPAAIFVPTDKIGEKGRLSWRQLKEMAAHNIEIGSHTLSECYLPDIKDDARLKREIYDSRRRIKEQIASGGDFIAYCSGGFNEKARQMVIDADYKGACATNPGKDYPDDDIYAMKRLRISSTSDNLFVFWIETSGFYTWIKEHRDED